MKAIGITTVGDLYSLELSTLEDHFGGYGLRLYQLARGIDHNPVVPNRVSKSISAEDTFPEDLPLADTELQIRRLAEKVWKSSHGNARAPLCCVAPFPNTCRIRSSSRLIVTVSLSQSLCFSGRTGLTGIPRTRSFISRSSYFSTRTSFASPSRLSVQRS
jgi:nucleotidyltransferase/DNA polymerase involved in DNA repair